MVIFAKSLTAVFRAVLTGDETLFVQVRRQGGE
jgi:hypothetical protein